MSLRRDRVVSISTALLALAGGVALGGGPLQNGGSGPAVDGADAAALTRARAQVTALERAREFDDDYVRATAPLLLRDSLDRRTVAVVTLPGANRARVAELTELVGVAGGAVTVRAAVRPALLDVGKRQLVAELARQTQEAARTPVRAPKRTEGYELTGRLLGHALADEENAGAVPDRTGEGILAGLSTAGLVAIPEPVTRRASLVLVLAGPPRGDDDRRQGAGSIVTALMEGLDVSSDGAVLAGPAAAAAPDGVLGALRTAPARREISTVGAVDSLAGAVVAVRALAAEARGTTGHYGGADAPDGVWPPV